MKSLLATAVALSGLTLIGGCISLPTGPSVMALPGTGKTLDEFRLDDAQCRQYALSQVGGTTAEQAASDAGVRSAVLGTLLGAIVGAAIGGRDGAGVGAGTGLLIGSLAGTDTARTSAYGNQRRYDHAYVQCMYARGENVPVSGTFTQPRSSAPMLLQRPPVDNSPPPPPPGNPPQSPPEYGR